MPRRARRGGRVHVESPLPDIDRLAVSLKFFKFIVVGQGLNGGADRDLGSC